MKLKFNYNSTERPLALKDLLEIAPATGIYSSHLRESFVKRGYSLYKWAPPSTPQCIFVTGIVRTMTTQLFFGHLTLARRAFGPWVQIHRGCADIQPSAFCSTPAGNPAVAKTKPKPRRNHHAVNTNWQRFVSLHAVRRVGSLLCI